MVCEKEGGSKGKEKVVNSDVKVANPIPQEDLKINCWNIL